MSLRASLTNLSATKSYVFFKFRDSSLLGEINTVAELQSKFDAYPVTKTTLQSLKKMLDTVGGSIVYVSPASASAEGWSVVGISGTFAALASISGVQVTQDLLNFLAKDPPKPTPAGTVSIKTISPPWQQIIYGVGVMTGGAAAVATGATLAPEAAVTIVFIPADWALIGFGYTTMAGGAAMIGDGVYDLWNGPTTSTTPLITIPTDADNTIVPTPDASTPPVVYGPPNIPEVPDPAGAPNMTPIDPDTLPSDPPSYTPPEPPGDDPPDI